MKIWRIVHVNFILYTSLVITDSRENFWRMCRLIIHGRKPGDEDDSLHSQDTSLLDNITVTHVVNSLLSFHFFSPESGDGRNASFHALQKEKCSE